MTDHARGTLPEIRRGRIYRDVYRKRVDEETVHRTADLEQARLGDDGLVFRDTAARSRAFAHGVFLLEIPESLALSAGDRFARQFFQGADAEPYGKYRDVTSEHFGDGLLGYHSRVDQLEQFLLERRFWGKVYPPEIMELGEHLTLLSHRVLRSVLACAGIPERDWIRASGGCSDANGSYHLTFNHYRPAHRDIGLSSHKDDGFITVLRTTAPGLEVNRDEVWEKVPVDPSCFVVNFGLSMEILTASCATPLSAILHRVTQQDFDRSSFGHFSSSRCLPGADDGVYRYLPGAGLERVCGSRELIEENDHEIYAGTESEGQDTQREDVQGQGFRGPEGQAS